MNGSSPIGESHADAASRRRRFRALWDGLEAVGLIDWTYPATRDNEWCKGYEEALRDLSRYPEILRHA